MDLATNNKNAPLHAAFANALTEGATLPNDIQYMPPGRHRIRASQGGKPVSVEVAVNAATAAVLQTFLTGKLTAAAEGREDRPFFDFNHEDREASAWPTEFYWAVTNRKPAASAPASTGLTPVKSPSKAAPFAGFRRRSTSTPPAM
jgi:hypothetical protein